MIDGMGASIFANGREEGRKEGGTLKLFELVQEGLLSVDAAAKNMGVTIEDFKRKAAFPLHNRQNINAFRKNSWRRFHFLSQQTFDSIFTKKIARTLPPQYYV